MNKKDSIWESIGNYYFWTKIAPEVLAPIIIILLIVLILIIQLSNSAVNDIKYKNDKNTILATRFVDTTYKYAKDIYNKDEFTIKLVSNDDKIEYTFKDGNKNASQYDALAKEEISKLYNKLKDKRLIDDYVFSDIGTRTIELEFDYPTDYTFNYLGFSKIEYNEGKGFNNDKYNEEINSTIITDERLQKVINRNE